MDETNVEMIIRDYKRSAWVFGGDPRPFTHGSKGKTTRIDVAVCAGLLFWPGDDYANRLPPHDYREAADERDARQEAYANAAAFGASFCVTVGGDAGREGARAAALAAPGRVFPGACPEFAGVRENIRAAHIVVWCAKPPEREGDSLGLFFAPEEGGGRAVRYPALAPRGGGGPRAAEQAIRYALGGEGDLTAAERTTVRQFLVHNSVETRAVGELGELKLPRQEAHDEVLRDRAERLLRGEWGGLPRHFYGARNYKGGAEKAYLSNSYDFIRFLQFTSYCLHAFFGERVRADVRIGWDNAPSHGRIEAGSFKAGYLHEYCTDVLRVAGVVFLPMYTPASNPIEATINYMKRHISTVDVPFRGQFTPAAMVSNVAQALMHVRTSHLLSWFRASCYRYRSRHAMHFDGTILAETETRGGRTVHRFTDVQGVELQRLPARRFCVTRVPAEDAPPALAAEPPARGVLEVYADSVAVARMEIDHEPSARYLRKVEGLFARFRRDFAEYALSLGQVPGDASLDVTRANDALYLMEGILTHARRARAARAPVRPPRSDRAERVDRDAAAEAAAEAVWDEAEAETEAEAEAGAGAEAEAEAIEVEAEVVPRSSCDAPPNGAEASRPLRKDGRAAVCVDASGLVVKTSAPTRAGGAGDAPEWRYFTPLPPAVQSFLRGPRAQETVARAAAYLLVVERLDAEGEPRAGARRDAAGRWLESPVAAADALDERLRRAERDFYRHVHSSMHSHSGRSS